MGSQATISARWFRNRPPARARNSTPRRRRILRARGTLARHDGRWRSVGAHRCHRDRHDDEDARHSRRGAIARQGRESLRELRRSAHARTRGRRRWRRRLRAAGSADAGAARGEGRRPAPRHGAVSAACVCSAVREHPKIEIRFGTIVEEVLGNGGLTGVRTRAVSDGKHADLELAGLFVYVGLAPATAWLNGLTDLDPSGRIATDIAMRCRQPGLFAAGTVRSASAGRAAAAAGDGATAAIAADAYLRDSAGPSVRLPSNMRMR